MHRAHYTNLIAQGFDAYSSLVYAQHDEHIHQRFVVEIEQSYKNYPRRRNRRPVAVLVAAYNSPLLQHRYRLAKHGFNVMAAHSLLDGYTQTLQLLALPKRVRPTLVFLDIFSTQPGFPELPGSLIAAVLAQHMRLKEIHPAWLIGLAERRDPQCETEALVAGCHQVLSAPLSDDMLLMLQELALQPPSVPHLDALPAQMRIIRVLQHMAVRVLQSVRDAYIETWTADDLAQVLRLLTRYPKERARSAKQAPTLLAPQAGDPQRLIRALGGTRNARERLRTTADQWQWRYPLHGQILHKFLDGYERREIVRYFVTQGLYEDTRIYTCIKELPERLSEQFRLDALVASLD